MGDNDHVPDAASLMSSLVVSQSITSPAPVDPDLSAGYCPYAHENSANAPSGRVPLRP
jgi:hypothetical protein